MKKSFITSGPGSIRLYGTISIAARSFSMNKCILYLSRGAAFPTRLPVHPAKTQVSLPIRAV